MKIIFFVACFFAYNKTNAFIKDTLLSEFISPADTLIIKSEYFGCLEFKQKEVKLYFENSNVKILFFDSLEMKITPKGSLTYKQKNTADKILKKFESGVKLTSKEKKYISVNINQQNSLFIFSKKYLENDTIFLDKNFDFTKEHLISFEKTVKEKSIGSKSDCIGVTKNCRVKVTMSIKNEKMKYEYFLDGCNDINALLINMFKSGTVNNALGMLMTPGAE
jgi:hypothetical protein